jgi:hypothetical protein
MFTRTGKLSTWGESQARELDTMNAAQAELERHCEKLEREGWERTREWEFVPDRFDFELFRRELLDAVPRVWSDTRAAHPAANAFALYTDSSRTTIVPVAHNFESLATADDDILWNPGEWSYFDKGGHLDIAYRLLLSKHRDKVSTVDFSEWVDGFDETVCTVLEELAKQRVLGDRAKLALVYCVSDDNFPRPVLRLNEGALADRFEQWLHSWHGLAE